MLASASRRGFPALFAGLGESSPGAGSPHLRARPGAAGSANDPPPAIALVSVECPLAPEAEAQFARAGFAIPALLANAVEKRRAEFAAGRYCAWRALQVVGYSGGPGEVGIGPGREPLWPAGYVGSIAHAHGLAAGVAARADRFAGVGIDCEPVMSEESARETGARIFAAAAAAAAAADAADAEPGVESKLLPGLSEAERVTLVFAAKEAIYKCLRPVCGRFFGFQDAELTRIDLVSRIFEYRLAAPIGGSFYAGWTGHGRIALDEGWAFAGVALARDGLA